MNVPLSSAKGPKDIAFLQPITSVKKSTACAMSGTVTPVWSWPRMPGMESADAMPAPPKIVAARTALRRMFFTFDVSHWRAVPFCRIGRPLGRRD